jgi:lysophospholipase L1-like esterase
METVRPRFFVRAESRFPSLWDYNSDGHQFEDSYVNPVSYTITVEDFPGMHLYQKGTNPDENQGPRSGGHLHYSPDVYELDCPADTTGWRFTLNGRISQPAAGRDPSDTKVHLEGKTLLPKLIDSFAVVGGSNPVPPERANYNPWDWHFAVPGQGTYSVTAYRMSGANIISQQTGTLTIKDYLIASIGDSAASGEGNPDVPGIPAEFFSHSWWEYIIPYYDVYVIADDYYNWAKQAVATDVPVIARAGGLTINMRPGPTWLEEKAHRSLHSGHAYAAQSLEDLYEGTVVTFLPFGRSGSDIPNGLIGPRISDGNEIDSWVRNVGQIDELKATVGSRRIDALLVYIGINDIGVSGTLTDLIEGDAPIIGQGDPTAARRHAQEVATINLGKLPSKLDTLAKAFSTLNVGQIYLTEYPTGLFDDRNGNPAPGCELFGYPELKISLDDAKLVKEIASKINGILKTAADHYHWIYITGIDQQLGGRGYCTGPGRRAFTQCGESLLTQGDTEGTIHPNSFGHLAIGKAVAQSILDNTVNPPGPTPGNRWQQLDNAMTILAEKAV